VTLQGYRTKLSEDMPETRMNWLDILLFAGIVIMLTGIGFVGAIEGWRQWSDNRRIRKHLRN